MDENNNICFETPINGKITGSCSSVLLGAPGKKTREATPTPSEIASFWTLLPFEFLLPSVGGMDIFCNRDYIYQQNLGNHALVHTPLKKNHFVPIMNVFIHLLVFHSIKTKPFFLHIKFSL